jgi:hypothetical protein
MAEEERTGAGRVESLVKWTGLIGALIAVFTGVYQLWQANVLDARAGRR